MTSQKELRHPSFALVKCCAHTVTAELFKCPLTLSLMSVHHFILRRRLMRLMMSLQPLCIALRRSSAEKTVIKNIKLFPTTQWKQISSPVLRPVNRECHMFETTTVTSTQLRNAEEILLSVITFSWPQIKVNIYIKLINEDRKLVLEVDTANIAQSEVCIRS